MQICYACCAHAWANPLVTMIAKRGQTKSHTPSVSPATSCKLNAVALEAWVIAVVTAITSYMLHACHIGQLMVARHDLTNSLEYSRERCGICHSREAWPLAKSLASLCHKSSPSPAHATHVRTCMSLIMIWTCAASGGGCNRIIWANVAQPIFMWSGNRLHRLLLCTRRGFCILYWWLLLGLRARWSLHHSLWGKCKSARS
jgi:hypothetical protein